jgi:hypothetical protein
MAIAPPALVERLEQPKVVWQPLPGPGGRPGSQQLALSCPCHEILFHGTRGPGKTDTQIMFFRKHVGMGYGQFWRGVIFDRRYKNLEDLIGKTKRWFPQFGDGARFLSSGSLKWVWPTGEELWFRHMNDDSDYWNYHGQEFPFIGWNELTKYPTSRLYDMMMSCNRTSFVPTLHSTLLTEADHATLGQYGHDLDAVRLLEGDEVADDIQKRLPPEIPLTVFSTTNPFGAGHHWVKEKFVDSAPAGRIHRVTREVFDPRAQEVRSITKLQAHIFGSYRENRFLTPEYVLELEGITDPAKREAWLHGNWNIASGGALEGVWDASVHVVPRFPIPANWERLDRGFDWGSSAPFAVLWFARANGEEVNLGRGRTFCPPRNSLVVFNEWYGTRKVGTNLGLMLPARKVAEGIRDREAALTLGKWIFNRVRPGPADNQIFAVTEAESHNIATLMEGEGVTWTRSDKAAGTRKVGLELVRNALDNAKRGDRPGLYFMDHCVASIATLPNLPRDEDDPDDVDTEAEDHIYDVLRYRVLNAAKDFLTNTDQVKMY